MFWAEMSAGALVPGNMKSSPGGMLSQAERGRSKFLERISFCFISVCYGERSEGEDELGCVRKLLRQGMYCLQRSFRHRRREETLRHLSALGGNGAHHCIFRELEFREITGGWTTHGGKNHTSPALKSSTNVCPSSFTASTLTLPFST
jgi:hypothetical protein